MHLTFHDTTHPPDARPSPRAAVVLWRLPHVCNIVLHERADELVIDDFHLDEHKLCHVDAKLHQHSYFFCNRHVDWKLKRVGDGKLDVKRLGDGNIDVKCDVDGQLDIKCDFDGQLDRLRDRKLDRHGDGQLDALFIFDLHGDSDSGPARVH